MSDAWQFWMTWSVDLVIAIGTLAAVIVALFGRWIRAKLFIPRLALDIDNVRGDATPVVLTAPDGQSRIERARYCRVRVSNLNRWPKATQVRVQLVRYEEPGPDGQPQLKWAGVLTWSATTTPTPPGGGLRKF